MQETVAAPATESPPPAQAEAVGGQRKLPKHSLVVIMANRYAVDADKLLATLKATAFKQAADRETGLVPEVTNEQMMALLVVANEYHLNPFTREIYAFPDPKRGGIVPIVSIDGWSRIINEHDQFNGVEFVYGYLPGEEKTKTLEWIECVMYRRDREHPIRIREFFAECRRSTEPWKTHPSRMLRHKAMIQCARIAFGFAGIFDPDEADRIIEGESSRMAEATTDTIAALNRDIAGSGNRIALDSVVAPGGFSAPMTAGLRQPEPALIERGAQQAEPTTTGRAEQEELEAVTPAYVQRLIDKATGPDQLDEARDLIRHIGDEARRAELDVQERAKRKTFPTL